MSLQQEIRFPQMVTNCCRFLCYFCRISRQNQRSMFDHLSYLLQNSGIGLGEDPCVRGKDRLAALIAGETMAAVCKGGSQVVVLIELVVF